MSYNITITGHQPNGGRAELHQMKIAVAEMLNTLSAQGHQFDSQSINGETVNLHTDEGRRQAVQDYDEYQDILNDATREARLTSSTTAAQANDIAGDDPGLPNRGAPPESPVSGGEADIANPSPDSGPPGTLASQMETSKASGTPSGQPSGAANTGAGSQLSEKPSKAGEVSSDSSVPSTPTVTDSGKAQQQATTSQQKPGTNPAPPSP